MSGPAVKLYTGDCLAVMRRLASGSVDAVVTDPPGAIRFMGKAWDSDRGGRLQWCGWLSERLAEARRASKPGAYMLCWALPRTSHWTGCAIEDAGWRITDRIAHAFGSGFPKHKSKLKPAVEDWWLAWNPDRKATPLPGLDGCRVEGVRNYHSSGAPSDCMIYAQDEATKRWAQTRGPSKEHSSGRWPSNLLLSHSVNCRYVGTKRVKGTNQPGKRNGTIASGIGYGPEIPGKEREAVFHTDPDDYGRETVADWVCDESCPVRLIGEQSGESKSGGANGTRSNGVLKYNGQNGRPSHDTALIETRDGIGASTGTAARFFPNFTPDPEPCFYTAKASRAERNRGCEGMEESVQQSVALGNREYGTLPYTNERREIKPVPRANAHPTVKSQALMRWLCRLITPPGGLILDPFAGSGSTLCAAVAEGFDALGIEQDRQWIPVARRRIAAARKALAPDSRRPAGLTLPAVPCASVKVAGPALPL